MAEQEYDTLVGTIVGAHGIQGAMKVKFATPTALAMIAPAPRPSETAPRPTVTVWVGESPESGREMHVVSAKRQDPKELYLIRFTDVSDRTGAERLIGKQIFVPHERRVPLDADEFFVEDLIGAAVRTEGGTDLGRIASVLQSPANDVYETDTGAMIPVVKEFVLGIDVQARTITVRDIPGLKPEEQASVEQAEAQEARGPRRRSPRPQPAAPDGPAGDAAQSAGSDPSADPQSSRRRLGAQAGSSRSSLPADGAENRRHAGSRSAAEPDAEGGESAVSRLGRRRFGGKR